MKSLKRIRCRLLSKHDYEHT
ncbi:hypothetical protein R3I94_013758 [Phoxinus phoxinus]